MRSKSALGARLKRGRLPSQVDVTFFLTFKIPHSSAAFTTADLWREAAEPMSHFLLRTGVDGNRWEIRFLEDGCGR